MHQAIPYCFHYLSFSGLNSEIAHWDHTLVYESKAMALFSSKKPQPPSPKWAAAEVKTDFPESAKKAWKEGLSKPKEKFLERKEELTEWLGGEKKFDEIVKKIEDREECHWLERFYVSKDEDKPNACTRVCFKEQGDAIPAGRDKEFQAPNSKVHFLFCTAIY